MGCCSSELRDNSKSEMIQLKLKESIERSNTKSIQQIIRPLEKPLPDNDSSLLNEPITRYKEVEVNSLGYSLVLGKIDVFKHLHQKLGANIGTMEKLFEKQGINPLDILCQQGYVEMLNYYLPHYLATHKDSLPHTTEDSMTVDFQRAAYIDVPIKKPQTAIHLACERGYINVINYIHNYFKDEAFVPHFLDIDYQDDYTGENCAMIAVRNGNYAMIKFLHETCRANFNLRNKRHEGVVQVAAAGSKKNVNKDYLEVFEYLVEVIKCDITDNYEETLLMIDDTNVVKYLEKMLKKAGINVKKKELEERNKIVPRNLTKEEEEVKMDDFGQHNFVLGKMLEEPERKSMLSSIIPSESKLETPFISVFEGN
ncbi:unnamed protein product [Blepharisma stoltei]|uniref:Uncharacterized protein n=1 Tax=Blepharisma stoltei TaxID=1481888 RepID=A0AAU9JTV6_9CILI|nr:unnamed protein product [Blepharisma stoltei]